MEYSKIFGFESSKLLELFTLLNTANNVYTIEELSCSLQVDPKTILKYINKLSELFGGSINDFKYNKKSILFEKR